MEMIKISKKNLSIAYSLRGVGWKSSEITQIANAYSFSDNEKNQIRQALLNLEGDK